MDNIAIRNGLKMPDLGGPKGQDATAPSGKFSEALKNAVDDVSKLQNGADKAILGVQTGNTGSLHEAMIALEKADISFRTMLSVRNKLVEAYQEIMRMQV